MSNPLLDMEFLRKLDLTKNKATYAKIILLTWNEEPVEEIQGKITAGSVNIDGNSAVRRTCSLTMVSNKVDINNTYWALKNKFKLEVGVENTIDSRYPDIIWFKQGLYVFTSLNMSVQSNNFTISLNGKDKMCLLNGEVGGSINASTDFGRLEEYETLDNGEIVRNIVDIPIVDIVKNAIHTYAGEPFHNIILNDIDNYGLELLEYRGDKNLYMPRKISTGDVNGFIINPKQEYYLQNGEIIYVDNEANKNAGNKEIIYYDRTGLNEHFATKVWVTPGFHSSNDLDAYNIIKIEYGETAGYRRTDLTYPGELVANVGESLVTILDKIKNMFGDFEYFYDIDGRFIFQKKKTYINTSFNNLTTSEKDIYAEDAAYTSSTVYSFEEGLLLTAFTNAPQILNIKNDFSIWGKRKGVGGTELPVHMRYAIDSKPIHYKPIRFKYKEIDLDEKTYRPNKYYIHIKEIDKYILATSTSYDDTKKPYYEETDIQILDDDSLTAFTIDNYDWREIIYQMALDYFKYNHKKDNFTQLIAAANPDHYPTGITGYETYYTDMQGFWRQLYHPGVVDETYELFTRQELFEAARESILQERKLIEEEDISQLIIDYIYDNFNTVRNNFIESIEYTPGSVDPARDISEIIANCVQYGFTESTKVIQGLLADRWEKMGGVDNHDYEAMMADEYEQNGNSAMYKTYQILNNYKAEKEFLDIYSDVDLSLMIAEKISQGYTEDSMEIQTLLSVRWKKMMLIYKEDPFDYLKLMEEQYSMGGENNLYQAYLMMYNYKNSQKTNYVDADKIIMKEEQGEIILDAYLRFLYNARERKISNYGYDSLVVSNIKFIWIISTVIKTFEKTKKDFKSSIEQMIDQQFHKDAYDFSQELIDYVVEEYANRLEFFSFDDETDKIIVKNAHIQYLLDMRQEKIYEMGNDFSVIENDVLVKLIFELINENSDVKDFKEEFNEKLEEINKTLLTDYSQAIIDFIYNNYDSVIKFEENTKILNKPLKKEEDNTITINNDDLQDLFESRKNKIDTYTNFQVFIDNSELAEKLIEAIEEGYLDKEKYKEEIQSRLKSALTTKKKLIASPKDSIVIKSTDNAFEEITETQILKKLTDNKEEIIEYFKENYDENGWNKNIKTAPETLNFWFDFMDIGGEMGKYAAKAIGNRPKAVNNDKVTAIYFQETPSVMFLTPEQYEELVNRPEDFVDMTGYTFVNLQPFMENYFTISSQGKSAKDELDSLLYQHTYATETTTLTALPIYHLQPNTRVLIKDDNTGINGEYIVSKITIPLQYNGTSSITTTKAVERIY